MSNRLGPRILGMIGALVLLSCGGGGSTPDMMMMTMATCTGVVCSTQNITNNKCVAGKCDGTCNSGFADCDDNKQKDGCETNINTDPNNCGGCGNVCSNNHIATPTCVGGICTGTCETG